MRVFISYSRQDAPFVYALKYILESRKIRCLVDRAMPSGSQFPDEIKAMIREADVVIVVLTRASQDSTWVNHECGFALAEKKKIWPIALEKDVQPWGMLSNLQSHSMFDWGDPKRVFEDFIKALKSSHLNDEDHFRALGMDRVISGQVERTEFVVAQLRRLVKAGDRKLRVYNQAIFSSFAVIDDQRYWNGESIECNKSYRKLLLEERSLLDKLARMPSVSFTLNLCPLPYGYADNSIRYQGLLKWMRDNVDQPGVRLCCSKFAGHNRLMVVDDFAIESSFDPDSGYSRNIVSYDKVKILKAADEVEAFCKNAFTAKDAVDEIERRFESYKKERR